MKLVQDMVAFLPKLLLNNTIIATPYETGTRYGKHYSLAPKILQAHETRANMVSFTP
jgi:hypothetical protein